ncbi:DUF6602 domain-containing protein [Odoribacter lunatus]|uniref:DUF6602 domain-containing protein n=1 Tax=Odoribacter lunatus TaxID=2941335 RepID=UPI00203ACB73|nr:DUF6602 domain-containing protein [Odoribacter lunatus]
MKTEFYRLRAEELYNKLLQISQFNIKHNLTIGMFAEDLLRDSLKMLLPQKASISQGFITNGESCSSQCDIIIYDSLNFAPLFKTESLVVLPVNSVIAVIEVKTTIGEKQFHKTLKDFSLLHSMGIKAKYLFIYNSPSVKTLKNYFFSEMNKEQNCSQKEISTGLGKYDYDNYEELPEAIVNLKPQHEFLLKKDYVITDHRDMMGYTSLILNDNTNKPVSCLEEFMAILLTMFGIILGSEYGNSYDKYEGIPLFDM